MSDKRLIVIRNKSKLKLDSPIIGKEVEVCLIANTTLIIKLINPYNSIKTVNAKGRKLRTCQNGAVVRLLGISNDDYLIVSYVGLWLLS